MAVQDLIEVKFRLSDGSDIGPSKYSPTTTVAALKEKILAQWPRGWIFYATHFDSAMYVYLMPFLGAFRQQSLGFGLLPIFKFQASVFCFLN